MTVTKGKLVVAGGEGVSRGGKQYLDDMEIFTGTRYNSCCLSFSYFCFICF